MPYNLQGLGLKHLSQSLGLLPPCRLVDLSFKTSEIHEQSIILQGVGPSSLPKFWILS